MSDAEELELFPFAGIEKGYFLDVQRFFREKKLVGFKVLCSRCNYGCYYCHRRGFLNKKLSFVSASDVLKKMEEHKPYNIVTFTGGEITLAATPAAKMMDFVRNSGATALFSTNGFLTEQVDYLTKHADLVKIDAKGSRRVYEKVTGVDGYEHMLESAKICSSRLNTEVKIMIHSFTSELDIGSLLQDLKNATGFPESLILEFQLVKDFLHEGISEPNVDRFLEICREARPKPSTVFFKHYEQEEFILELIEDKWELYKKKEIPLKFDW